MALFPTTQNRAPARVESMEVMTQSRIKLRAAFAAPRRTKGTVIILGGRAEFIERYFETMSDLMERGFAVATFDWRGQGGSQRLLANPVRGHINSFAQYDEDLDTIYSRVLVAQCPKPFYGLAHSTGGHIMLRSLRGKKWLEKAVITAPLLGLHYGSWPEGLAKALARAACATGLSASPLAGFSSFPMKRSDFAKNLLHTDRRRWDRDISVLEAQPALGIGGPTYGWLNAAIKSMAELMQWPQGQGPSCPTLIVTAGRDRVVNNEGTKAFLKAAPGFSNLTISDSEHEIMNEVDSIREKFFAAFDGFMGV